MRWSPIVAFAALLIAGCSGGPSYGDDEGSPSGTSASPTTSDSPLADRDLTIVEHHTCDVDTDSLGSYLASSEAEWGTVWEAVCTTTHSDPPERPAVDFARHFVLMVVDEERPSSGYAIEVEAVHVVDGLPGAHVVRTAPGATCYTLAVITHPIDIVVVERPSSDSVDEMDIEFRDEVQECEAFSSGGAGQGSAKA